MNIEAAKRVSVRTEKSTEYVKSQVCVYWLQGRCNRNPCHYMHKESVPFKSIWTNPNILKKGVISVQDPQEKSSQKVCQYWLTDNCVHGDNCKDVHSLFIGYGFSMLTILQGHTKGITGISLPFGSDKLYSGSKDGSIRVWDCHNGQCTGTVKLECEASCLISEGPWVFIGLNNTIKAWNLQAQKEFILNCQVSKVCSMVVGNNILFAGMEGGTILAWKFSSKTNTPELIALLQGHTNNVVTLIVGANKLYSGSKDTTIRVWDLENMKYLQTLYGHSYGVTAVLCWDSFLLSSSLDNTLKVWAVTENGNLEVVYEQKEECGILGLCGIHNVEANKSILLCTCEDNSVRLYDLPTFGQRGRIFSKQQVNSIQQGCNGLFFMGDESGRLTVWKFNS